MYRSGQDFFQRRWRVRARKLVLAAGLSLMLVGAGHSAPSSAGESDVAATPTPSSTPVVTPEVGAPSPPADGGVLRATILSPRPADARAIITDGQGRQRVYARGDEIADGGEVVEIQRDYVVVRRGGRLETLEFPWNAATRKLQRASPGAAQVTAPRDNSEVLRHEMFTHPGLLLQLVGASAVVEGGQFRGYRVMQPEDPTFIESLGLKPGDILTGVNGMPFTPDDYGAQVLDAAMSGTDKLTYTVQRGNQVLVVSE